MKTMPRYRQYKILLVCLFGLLVLLFAWNCDDAYHGFVMSRNLANGNGFVYNAGERVTASTCPLFSILLGVLGIVCKNYVFLSFAVCTAFSTAAFAVIVFRLCKKPWQDVMLFFLLIASYSFFSYTTAGLENCLLFFLEALYLSMLLTREKYDARRLVYMALLCAAVLLTRIDAGIILFFSTAYCFLKKRGCGFFKMIGAGVLGLLPFAAWEVFSVLYYGAFFPNTYYIKKNTGFPLGMYLRNGALYLAVSELFDVILGVVIVLAVLFMLRSKQGRLLCLALGMAIKTVYIVWIGGDFMLGRHFSDMYFMAAVVLLSLCGGEDVEKARILHVPLRRALAFGLCLCVCLTLMLRSVFVTGFIDNDHFADEKLFYSRTQSITSIVKGRLLHDSDVTTKTWGADRKVVKRSIEAGYRGDYFDWAGGELVYEFNDGFYMTDKYGLGDPLLSHLPAVPVKPRDFKTGHMYRQAPAGYRESVRTGENRIEDESLHEYFDIVCYVTRGAFWDVQRMRTAVGLALGRYDGLVNEYLAHISDQT